MDTSKMEIDRVRVEDILALRREFLAQNPIQIRYNACHERGWSDSYRIMIAGEAVGYFSVKGLRDLSERDTIFEFFLLPPFQAIADRVFPRASATAQARYVEAQTNEPVLASLLAGNCINLSVESILFKDGGTAMTCCDGVFRPRGADEPVPFPVDEPSGNFVVEHDGRIVAVGGYLTHYNVPFADIFFTVDEAHRGRGFGSSLARGVMEECRGRGYVPAARCHVSNIASKTALVKAGFSVAGMMMSGTIAKQ